MKRDERELEHGLRALFQAERAGDAQSAPGFARVLAARPHPRRLGWLPAAVVATALLVAVAVGARSFLAGAKGAGESPASTPASGWAKGAAASSASAQSGGATLPLQPAGGQRSQPRPPTLSEWKSPTAALLETPGSELWTTAPVIGRHEFPVLSE